MKIVHFADLHLGVESYGYLDPISGFNTRFLDFLSSFDRLVDFAIEQRTDLVLFCGDAYKSRDPSQTQQREFARRIKRLSESGIPVFLLTGNHDLPNAVEKATSTEIFDTLRIENVTVAGKAGIHRIKTRNGIVQIVALPWPKRANMLSMVREENKNLSIAEMNQRLQDSLTNIINALAAKLDNTLPSILAAHVWVQGARVGSENSMTIGQEHVLLPSAVSNPLFDYVALGHIHRHQSLGDDPPVVYSGSLDSLDFGDENDTKGFYVVDIEKGTSQKRVNYKFYPSEGRRFVTIKVSIHSDNEDPVDMVLKALDERASDLAGNIVRLDVDIPRECADRLDDNTIRKAASEAYYFSISRNIKGQNKPRLGNTKVEGLDPVQALAAYINLNRENISDSRAEDLMRYGKEIINFYNNAQLNRKG
jgi:exonuclease SbcD